MRKLSILLLAALFILSAAFTGCSDTSVVWSGYCLGADQVQASDMVSLSCTEFNGQVIYTIHVKEEHKLIIDSEYTVSSGILTVSIVSEEGNALFYGTIDEDWYYSTYLPDYGTYSIIVEAQGFKGSYIFSWAK